MMLKNILKLILCFFLFIAPAVLYAQGPGFSYGLGDVCVDADGNVISCPIDQQTLLLASCGAIYAIQKLRQRRRS